MSNLRLACVMEMKQITEATWTVKVALRFKDQAVRHLLLAVENVLYQEDQGFTTLGSVDKRAVATEILQEIPSEELPERLVKHLDSWKTPSEAKNE
jgi:hypothetical protein